MSNQLFPVFDSPEIKIENPAEKQKYRQSVSFDFGSGDFNADGSNNMTLTSGRDVFIQWCMTVLHTERGSCLAYNSDIGVEMIEAMAMPSEPAQCSAIERTVKEALMVNPQTEYVRDFTFQNGPDYLICSFRIKGKPWEELPLQLAVPKGG